ncbi:Microcystin-dependent protein [Candidatus Magnetomoraceae bacterium gMMP-15]
MPNPFIGEIRLFPYNDNYIPPKGWALCNGQRLKISDHTSLYALIGTTYGGDGNDDFALPDLRGRVPLGAGQEPFMETNYYLGEQGGADLYHLRTDQMPEHAHTVDASSTLTVSIPANSGRAETPTPSSNTVLASGNCKDRNKTIDVNMYTTQPSNTNFTANVTGKTCEAGGNQYIDNRQPYLALHYCIALEGTFPSRT